MTTATERNGRAEPLISHRGHVLVGQPSTRPVVAVELYVKWYGLSVIMPDSHVEEVPFPTVDGMNSYVDHVPNPAAVSVWAEQLGYNVDELSFEMMVGRWSIEVLDEYQ